MKRLIFLTFLAVLAMTGNHAQADDDETYCAGSANCECGEPLGIDSAPTAGGSYYLTPADSLAKPCAIEHSNHFFFAGTPPPQRPVGASTDSFPGSVFPDVWRDPEDPSTQSSVHSGGGRGNAPILLDPNGVYGDPVESGPVRICTRYYMDFSDDWVFNHTTATGDLCRNKLTEYGLLDPANESIFGPVVHSEAFDNVFRFESQGVRACMDTNQEFVVPMVPCDVDSDCNTGASETCENGTQKLDPIGSLVPDDAKRNWVRLEYCLETDDDGSNLRVNGYVTRLSDDKCVGWDKNDLLANWSAHDSTKGWSGNTQLKTDLAMNLHHSTQDPPTGVCVEGDNAGLACHHAPTPTAIDCPGTGGNCTGGLCECRSLQASDCESANHDWREYTHFVQAIWYADQSSTTQWHNWGRTYPGPFVGASLDLEGVDADADGVEDDVDNCDPELLSPYLSAGSAWNPLQRDDDGDGVGNACDADYDQNGVIGSSDLQHFKLCFAAGYGVCINDGSADPCCKAVDMDENEVIGLSDLAAYRLYSANAANVDPVTFDAFQSGPLAGCLSH